MPTEAPLGTFSARYSCKATYRLRYINLSTEVFEMFEMAGFYPTILNVPEFGPDI